MGQIVKDAQGNVSHSYRRIMIGANVAAGQLLIRNAAQTGGGEGINPTTTAAADIMGIAPTAVTYDATQAGLVSRDDIEWGRFAGVVMQPFAVMEFLVSGGATANTALNANAPANILTATAASATGVLVTAAEVGTADMRGGLMIGLTGANAGQRRRITLHTDNTSESTTVQFKYPIAAGDVFMRLPYSMDAQNVQLTTDFVQANGVIAYGTGIPAAVWAVLVDIVRRTASVQVVARDSQFNPLA